jgi:hypothetical protein
VARSSTHLTVGVGVLSAFLLFGGPGVAIALADPGNSHSDHGNDGNRDGEHGRGDSESGDADDDDSGTVTSKGSGDADVSGGSHHAIDTPTDDVATPKVRVGSGREDTQWLAPGGSIAADPGVTDAIDPGVTVAIDEPGATGETGLGDEPGATGGTGPTDAPGSARFGGPESGFQSPQVTFGNGRTPGAHLQDPEPQWQAPAPQPAPEPASPPPPPPLPAPAPPASWVDRIATPPLETTALGVAPAADWSDPLWGVAGLLLIPAAGAALGYRQARATQAVDRLRRTRTAP